ncbi:SUKH-3 domain-containing protein [Pyxidicoccus caerfyrddinensis]|uniref:SUKH-3 domain-containing protein n=1 Tax=Pyxidicoccus caerfyrddinensis TaxID=2709663 RepID=UPI0013DA4813|nr:SUKH-3 domain-containing protein [Pyxidicoccus caerfyrddinensis]
MVMTGPGLEFSPKVVSRLAQAGGSSARRVDIRDVRARLESAGHPVHPEAARVLEAFQGLTLEDDAGRTVRMDGAQVAAAFERDELLYLRALLPSRLCPVGEGAGMIYLVAEDGRWVALHNGWTVMCVFADANHALLFALTDENPEADMRMLGRDDVPDGY